MVNANRLTEKAREAVVTAQELARFLPDKAIDLVDEAASRLLMEIDSMLQEIDEIERRIMQLEIERQALRKESDPASKERLARLEQELANLKEQGSEGYDPTYGARPLKRTIQRLVLDPLALKVLQGDFRDGDSISVDAERGSLVFRLAERSTSHETSSDEPDVALHNSQAYR